MESGSFSLAIVCSNSERFSYFKSILKESFHRIVSLPFGKRIEISLSEEVFDIVLVDAAYELTFGLQSIQHLLEHKNLRNKLFIFILNPSQDSIKHQIYRLPNSQILFDPVDKFSLITAVHTGLRLSALQNRVQVYKELLEGEQKLITYMDELLEIDQMHQFDRFAEVREFLQETLLKKIELTLAVEKAFFGFVEKGEQRLRIEQSGRKNQLERVVYFSYEHSLVLPLLEQNKAQVLERADLADSFVQELEEFLGFRIFSLLFAPVNVFHREFGAIVLINKIYRESFYENDLAFATIAAQRISFVLEQFLLDHPTSDALSEFSVSPVNTKEAGQFKLIKSILDAVNFGVTVFDDRMNIHYLNPGAQQILNFQQPIAQVRRLQDILSKNVINEIRGLLKNRELPIVRHEVQLESRLFPDSYIGLSIYPLNSVEEQGNKYIMVFSEITQTKRIQAEIIRMDRMASLGVLSAGIAHEIRNPLAGIKAMAQSLEDELKDDPQKLEYIARILRQVDRLDKLLRAFFTYARPVRPDPSPSSIKKIVNEVLPLIQSKLRERDIKFTTAYASDLANVFVDQNQIQQVLLNLFLNAIDAMPSGGMLKVEAQNAKAAMPVLDRRKRIPALLSDKFIEIKVTDTGIGISPDELELIFNPFFTTKSQGTGLGLSIVYQIIKEHGGQIDVKSVPDKGTTFTILLPAI